MDPVRRKFQCPECHETIVYETERSDGVAIVSILRGAALLLHDSECHWPTVVSSHGKRWQMRCILCHGPVQRVTAHAGSNRVVVFPCGHPEGSEAQVCRLPEPDASITQRNTATSTVWEVTPIT
jgi:hypothetical protein